MSDFVISSLKTCSSIMTMKGLMSNSQKRQYKSSEVDGATINISASSGVRSPRASPRRTPKKRKSRPSFRIPSCKRVLEPPDLSTINITELNDEKDGDTDIKATLETDTCGKELEVTSISESLSSLTEDNSHVNDVKQEDEIVILAVVSTESNELCLEIQTGSVDPDSTVLKSNDGIVKESSAKGDVVKQDSAIDSSGKLETVKLESKDSKSTEETSSKCELEINQLVKDKAAKDSSLKENSQKDISKDEKKKSEEVDEGYFDSSYLEQEKILEKLLIDASTETAKLVKTDATTVTEQQDSLVDLLNKEFKSKLCLNAGVQTEEAPSKRRKVNKSCQITDDAASTLNRRLLTLRNKLNRAVLEKESVLAKNSELEGKCSHLATERLSLLAQTEALQKECVKKMYDNDKLNEKVQQRECHVATLKESLLIRDKELHLLHRQPDSTAGIAKQINEYRELEMLRVDNIRLLHDNRALTTSLDSLNGQLCALRRISRNYDECRDSVIMMNKRLAEDNTTLSANLGSVRRELKSVTQEHHEVLEEVRCLRLSTKRSAEQRDETEKEGASTDAAEDNKILRKRNSELQNSVELLRGEVATLHTELANTRSAHLAFNNVLQEKGELHKQLEEVEARNVDLWEQVEELEQRCAEQRATNTHHLHERNILTGERAELRKTNDVLTERVEKLQGLLDREIEKNADMAKQIEELTSSLSNANVSIHDLQSTMEFLQVEHSLIEADVENKNESISALQAKVEELSKTKENLMAKCKSKLKEKTRKLNASRIKLGYALMEMRELNSHGSSCSE